MPFEASTMRLRVAAACVVLGVSAGALGLAGSAGAAAAHPAASTTGADPAASHVAARAAAASDDPVTTETAAPTTPEPAADSIVPEAPTRAVSYAARLVTPVVVRSKPHPTSKRITKLQPFGSWNGGPVVLAIAEVRTIGDERWLRVRLPIRPNGKTGWLPESTVEVRKLRYRIEISRAQHKLTLLRDGKRIASTKIVIGAPGTPTPTGTFAVLEVVRQPRGSELGPWALHLTAHSNVLDNFGGGPGRVAMHGRSGPLLNDPLGSSRSHGCIRMSNAFITRLHAVAREGTPVTIR